MKYQIRPLGQWPGPVTPDRKSSSAFKAHWDDTLVLLGDEIEELGGDGLVTLQIDVKEIDLRLDGMLKTRASVGPCPGVIVSFQSRFGPLQYASDAYEQRWSGSLPGWQANVRAVALALVALRAVDRYGVSKRGEQYTGWRALPPGNGSGFATADEALKWMRAYATGQLDLTLPEQMRNRDLYRFMARLMHPDRGQPRADWDRLDAARNTLIKAGLL